MPRPVSFYRWYRGKVWHVGFAQDAAACGSERPTDAETVGERAPVNARACGDCAASVRHLYGLVLAAEAGDPRKPFDPWAAGEALMAAEDDVVDAEIHCGSCDHVEHIGPCTLVEGSRITKPCDCYVTGEWPCGGCGHPNLDHDVDDMQWCRATGECLCPGLTRAG